MKDKLLKIINHYGIKHQREYLGREYQELQDEILYFMNGQQENLLTEIVDVMVLTFQFMALAGYDFNLLEDNLKRELKFKVDRQLDRMKEEE